MGVHAFTHAFTIIIPEYHHYKKRLGNGISITFTVMLHCKNETGVDYTLIVSMGHFGWECTLNIPGGTLQCNYSYFINGSHTETTSYSINKGLWEK